MNIQACLSHKTDDWKTPTDLYNNLMEKDYIDCFKYQSTENELDNNYYNKKLFINPPFSKMKQVAKWVKKQARNGNKIILLIPARTDTEYFHDLLDLKPVIYLIKGRLHYNDSKSAPFPTVALIFNEIRLFQIYTYGTIEKLKEFIK